MNQKSSNRASLIVAFITILFILGGVYLLNQSFSKPKTDDVASSLSSSKSSSKSSSSSSQSSSEESIIDESEDDSSESSSSEESSTGDESSSSSESNSSSSTSSINSSMGKTEALVKIVSVDTATKKYKIEVLDTGYENGKLWKKGVQFNINSSLTLVKDSQYKMIGITENSGKISYSNIVKA